MAGKLILTLSVAVLLLMGAGGLFGAHEVANALGAPDSAPTAAIIQLAASALLGLAVMNWFSRMNRIGGIYGRPLGLANLLLFFSSGLSIDKALAIKQLPFTWTPVGVTLSALALGFTWLVFVHDPLAGASQADRT